MSAYEKLLNRAPTDHWRAARLHATIAATAKQRNRTLRSTDVRGAAANKLTGVTQVLASIVRGDPHAADQLLPLVYDELRKLAAARLTHEKPGQTLQATALVHEAWLRLVDTDSSPHWNSRSHFFAAAAEAMRRILIDQARQKRSQRAGGDRQRIELAMVDREMPGPQLDLLALDEALQQLMTRDPRAAELVKLRFFAGLTMPEAAEVLAISLPTAENDWAWAKSWLKLRLSPADSELR